MAADTVVRARIDSETKRKAADALAAMGLSVSDAIRLMLVQVAANEALPFAVETPNRSSLRAMAELEGGRGKRLATAKELFDDLGI